MKFPSARATLLACFFASATAATSASAQEANWYAGVGAGSSKFKGACDGVTVSCDDTGSSWSLLGGYQFHRHWGAEIGYSDLGKAKANGTVSGVAVNASGKTQLWELVAVGSFPVAGQFSLYGKAGLYRAHTTVSANASAGGFTASTSGTDNNTGLTLGAGAMFDFAKNLQLRAQWQKYGNVGGGNTGGKSDIDVLSAAFVVKF